MLLPDLLTHAAARFPDKDAAVFAAEKIGFSALDRASRQVAARLARLGVGPGERVAILYENSLAALVYFWGVLRAGAQSVDIPNLSGQPAIASMLAEARPRALAISARQLAKLDARTLEVTPDLLLGTAVAKPHAAGRTLVTLESILAEEARSRAAPA